MSRMSFLLNNSKKYAPSGLNVIFVTIAVVTSSVFEKKIEAKLNGTRLFS